jgi:lysozyme family protein
MRANFAAATALELGYEGGYVNHPKDPGGPTKYGITLYALSQHRGRAVSAADVRALTAPEATAIYGEVYWPAVRGDQLPAGVDLMVYDAAINMGRGRAAKCLQRAAGVNLVDGLLGPASLAAVSAADPSHLVVSVHDQREALYRSFAGFPTFGKGWLRRLDSVETTALAWARKAARPVDDMAGLY